ncbi:MAG TPA: hypothetical protein VNK48_14320 [Xanthobacteraceae bacterium]|nr:hypothetical protein [Xanthobacteraceae bacterium]
MNDALKQRLELARLLMQGKALSPQAMQLNRAAEANRPGYADADAWPAGTMEQLLKSYPGSPLDPPPPPLPPTSPPPKGWLDYLNDGAAGLRILYGPSPYDTMR